MGTLEKNDFLGLETDSLVETEEKGRFAIAVQPLISDEGYDLILQRTGTYEALGIHDFQEFLEGSYHCSVNVVVSEDRISFQLNCDELDEIKEIPITADEAVNFLERMDELFQQEYGNLMDKVLMNAKAGDEKYSHDFTDIQVFLKNEIAEYCNENGEYEVFFDYREAVDESFLLTQFQKYCEDNQGYEHFEDYLQVAWEDATDIILDSEDNLLKEIEKDSVSVGYDFAYKVQQYLEQNADALEEVGYHGVTYDFDDLLANTRCKLNIMLKTDTEQNYDMCAIHDTFCNSEISSWFEDEIDNALTYLIHQQGYEVAEVIGKNSASDFVKSVISEIEECPDYFMMELSVSVSGSGRELLEALDSIAKGEGNIEFSADSSVGLFNEWEGTCSALEIELEQPLIVPADMVRNVQIEHAGDNVGYTINEVCDSAGTFWQGEMMVTDKEPELIHEDISAIRKAFMEKPEQAIERD